MHQWPMMWKPASTKSVVPVIPREWGPQQELANIADLLLGDVAAQGRDALDAIEHLV